MNVFGLTGGIASGKSTVATRFRERNVPVIDADQVARDIVRPGEPALAEIVQTFGEGVLATDGSLDRSALGNLVFRSAELRAKLNAITHPRIALRGAQRTAELATQGHPLAAWEAALLVESGSHVMFRPLVVVVCAEQTQLTRLMKRDQLSEDAARERIASQLSADKRRAVADFVIDTNVTIDEVRARADEVLAAIARNFGIDPNRYGMKL